MKQILIVALVLGGVSVAVFFAFSGVELLLEYANEEYAEMQRESGESGRAREQAGEDSAPPEAAGREPLEPPTGLSLPVNVSDLRTGGNVMVSPFGIVRRASVDQLEFGHGGIDLPLPPGSPLFAVADGEVIKYRPGTDMSAGGGGEIWLLLTGEQDGDPFDDAQGKGWVFIYEHIEPKASLAVGNRVKRGDVIAENMMETVYATVHLQLTYVFDKRLYTRDSRCWTDFLVEADAAALNAWFKGVKDENADIWSGIVEEGFQVHAGLLDKATYPNGPQMCYPPGTDGRVPVGGS